MSNADDLRAMILQAMRECDICWVDTYALGHGHCCFVHGDRKVNNGFKDDAAICHTREGVTVATGCSCWCHDGVDLDLGCSCRCASPTTPTPTERESAEEQR